MREGDYEILPAGEPGQVAVAPAPVAAPSVGGAPGAAPVAAPAEIAAAEPAGGGALVWIGLGGVGVLLAAAVMVVRTLRR